MLVLLYSRIRDDEWKLDGKNQVERERERNRDHIREVEDRNGIVQSAFMHGKRENDKLYRAKSEYRLDWVRYWMSIERDIGFESKRREREGGYRVLQRLSMQKQKLSIL